MYGVTQIAIHLLIVTALTTACSQSRSSANGLPPSSYESIQVYAEACGELMAREFGTGSTGEQEFAAWTMELEALEPPPELEGFHEAHTGQFSGQVKRNADGSSVIQGGNDQTQAMEIRSHGIIVELSTDLRNALLDGGCLTDADTQRARAFVAATDRIAERINKQAPLSVEEYVAHCVDVGETIPFMGPSNAPMKHMASGLAALQPPSELQKYNDAIVQFYRVWADTGVVPTSGTAADALRVQTVFLDDEFKRAMTEGGCR